MTWDDVTAETSDSARQLVRMRLGLFQQHRVACHRDAWSLEDYWSGYRVRLTNLVKRSRTTKLALSAVLRTSKRWPKDVREVIGV